MMKLNIPVWVVILSVIGIIALTYWVPKWFKNMNKNSTETVIAEAEAVIEEAEKKMKAAA